MLSRLSPAEGSFIHMRNETQLGIGDKQEPWYGPRITEKHRHFERESCQLD